MVVFLFFIKSKEQSVGAYCDWQIASSSPFLQQLQRRLSCVFVPVMCSAPRRQLVAISAFCFKTQLVVDNIFKRHTKRSTAGTLVVADFFFCKLVGFVVIITESNIFSFTSTSLPVPVSPSVPSARSCSCSCSCSATCTQTCGMAPTVLLLIFALWAKPFAARYYIQYRLQTIGMVSCIATVTQQEFVLVLAALAGNACIHLLKRFFGRVRGGVVILVSLCRV